MECDDDGRRPLWWVPGLIVWAAIVALRWGYGLGALHVAGGAAISFDAVLWLLKRIHRPSSPAHSYYESAPLPVVPIVTRLCGVAAIAVAWCTVRGGGGNSQGEIESPAHHWAWRWVDAAGLAAVACYEVQQCCRLPVVACRALAEGRSGGVGADARVGPLGAAVVGALGGAAAGGCVWWASGLRAVGRDLPWGGPAAVGAVVCGVACGAVLWAAVSSESRGSFVSAVVVCAVCVMIQCLAPTAVSVVHIAEQKAPEVIMGTPAGLGLALDVAGAEARKPSKWGVLLPMFGRMIVRTLGGGYAAASRKVEPTQLLNTPPVPPPPIVEFIPSSPHTQWIKHVISCCLALVCLGATAYQNAGAPSSDRLEDTEDTVSIYHNNSSLARSLRHIGRILSWDLINSIAGIYSIKLLFGDVATPGLCKLITSMLVWIIPAGIISHLTSKL
ncbi:hypothetical protein Pelo_10024 [Pelomyxa schiedti]|nr:hypothetical protein Pelo_10024 [Pelomyxa schiedti]